MNKRLDKIKSILIQQSGLREHTADRLMLNHDDLIDKMLSNNESEESVAIILEEAWIEEKTDAWFDMDFEDERGEDE